MIVLHAADHTAAPRCDEVAALPCRDYVVSWLLHKPADLYLVVANAYTEYGIAGLSCGIMYNAGGLGAATMSDGQGVDVYSWTLCASGLEYTNGPTGRPEDAWPASGGGNRITWDRITDCQDVVIGVNGVQAVAGVFYVYAYDMDYFAVTGNNNLSGPPELLVIDCDGTESPLLDGWATCGHCNFADYPTWGVNPCLDTPVHPTSWGRMKRRY